ncbi:hypothetical protein D9M72_303650 [compost metagenome]
MGKNAVLDGDLCRGNTPFGGSGGDQHGAGRGTRLAIALPGGRHRRGPAGALKGTAKGDVAIGLHIAGGPLHFDRRPVGIEFFRHQCGNTVIRALAHLELRRKDGHFSIAVDCDVGGKGM